MSTLKVTNIQATGETASRAVSGVAAAWVKYDSGGIIQNTSQNVSSVTDTASGRQTSSFTNSFDNHSYIVTSAVSDFLGGSNVVVVGAQDYSYTVSVSQCPFSTVDGNGGSTYTDATYHNLAFHGDLA